MDQSEDPQFFLCTFLYTSIDFLNLHGLYFKRENLTERPDGLISPEHTVRKGRPSAAPSPFKPLNPRVSLDYSLILSPFSSRPLPIPSAVPFPRSCSFPHTFPRFRSPWLSEARFESAESVLSQNENPPTVWFMKITSRTAPGIIGIVPAPLLS